ncbi:Iron only hydrogenase large subunit, C-terminal domain [Anaerovirgula multivorans]|uniref:Iron only hydrogenase large subunit, C-terminal domain n=1 Tax=Anaerovirgula multivorans TaxID=312168 RepID=A0A239J2B8_9FIRM|nr:[Fe-Fe] hydrogenase large subunit C-terminal domain-containing protein [Anaerovirgula multivorans]SNT00071.1 Iron only hydrogenase large subunit, C-terminal domain [Anaerovirgula multivorans]
MENNYALTLSDNGCKNCYKCIRNCPVKAIYFNKNLTEISSTRCIACGKCFNICPQKNKNMPNGLTRISDFIDNNRKMIASIDPTFVAYFGDNYKKLLTALRLLGFHYIGETAVAIDALNQHYEKIYLNDSKKHYITSACPTANLLIQKYYPELNEYMIPILSPMMVHGKLLKEKYGNESKVVFIGPCIAAKIECSDSLLDDMPLIDGVLSFQEVEDWIKTKNIAINELEDGFFDEEGSKDAKAFPLEGFPITQEKLPSDKNMIKVSGLENVKEILHSLMKDEVDPSYIEMNYCLNGCINGPVFHNFKKSLYSRKKLVQQYKEISGKIDKIESTHSTTEFDREFVNKKVENAKPNIAELRKILKEMGKFKTSDELNCGTCGYDTCRDKAIAVYNHMDKTEMCLPYIRNKSETISSLIFEHSPNHIFLVNRDLKIISINPAAVGHLYLDKQFDGDLHLSTILDFSDYMKVFETKKSICGKIVRLEEQNLTVIQNLLYIEEQDTVLAILNDITKEEQKEMELMEVKKNTADMLQKVITKQMMVVQEICSVLGETTAETKVALTKFLDVTLEKSGDR